MQQVLQQLGFTDYVVQLLMQYIITVRFSGMVNGVLTMTFSLFRGLRQGDLLSSYLFLFVSQTLSYLITLAREDGRLQRLRISHSALPLSNILFADDTLLFDRAIRSEANHLLDVIRSYSLASGQCVNFTKSHIYFS